ncbi:VolA/Pla-1 family phospholipase [Catenovulum sp. SX2]|uniref:VolA/Pla-1 family phospholipase n=1 Tax=Catenovulum sp. SX2 TaxID=3398614 RepID=UPI003F8285FD
MQQFKLGIIALSIAMLGACDNETIEDRQNSTENQPVVAKSRVSYDPSASVLSVPNDLLFSGTTDGTLNIPVVDATDFTDPSVALSSLDGWSYQQPFTIAFSVPAAAEGIDETSAQTPGAVRIFKAIMGGSQDPNHTECAAVPRGAACKIVSELTFGVDFVTQKASSESIAIVPMKPLDAQSTYIVTVTNMLEDGLSRPLEPSATYLTVRQNINTHPLGSESQLALQGAINSFEAAIATQGVDLDSVILTAAVTTQSATSLPALKKLMVSNPAAMPTMATPVFTGLDVKTALKLSADSCQTLLGKIQAGTASAAEQGAIGFCGAKLYTSNITLPYYNGTASVDNPTGATGDGAWWQAMCDSGATLLGAQAAGVDLNALPAGANDATCKALGLRDLGLDTERNTTQYNPVPAVKSLVNTNLQVTVPDAAYVSIFNQANVQMPTAGWPVVILQHGITSRKEDMLALTAALSKAGFATIAMDMVLHGSRGFDVTGDGNADVVANDEKGATAYMNLQNARAMRDNMRQSIVDLLRLRAAIASLAGQEFDGQMLDVSNVSFVGHSLGGIVGASFTAIANTGFAALGSDELAQAGADALFTVKAGVFANASGGVANFLLDSGSFGRFIKGSVLLANLSSDNASLAALAQGYATYLAQNGADLQALTAADHNQHFDNYLAVLATTNPAGVTAISSVISQYGFAVQTMLDEGDPNRYASWLAASGMPVLITEIFGDGLDPTTWDQVIPPFTGGVPGLPTSGTESFARLLGISAVTADVEGDTPTSGLIRYNTGGHSSLLDPSVNATVTTEMQTSIASFLASGGTEIDINDSSTVVVK